MRNFFVNRDRNPLLEAQELVYLAWESTNRRERVALAKQALEVCSDCADAYVLLAEESANSYEKARQYYTEGVKAAERAIGQERFRSWAGGFWGVLETRPYMRARAGLAVCCWEAGDREEAMEHAWALLKLNPNDNQGIRYLLANWLLAERCEADLKKLFRQYRNDPTAAWLFNRALWAFKSEGPGRKAATAVKEAIAANPHVLSFLLGLVPVPKHGPDRYAMGSEEEAAAYASDALSNWRNAPYALDWLREFRGEKTSKKRP